MTIPDNGFCIRARFSSNLLRGLAVISGLAILLSVALTSASDRLGRDLIDQIREQELARDELVKTKDQTAAELKELSNQISLLKDRLLTEKGWLTETKLNRKQRKVEALLVQLSDLDKRIASLTKELLSLGERFNAEYQRNTEYLLLELREVTTRYQDERRSVDLELKRRLARDLTQWRRSRIYVDSVTSFHDDYTVPDITVASTDSPEDIEHKAMYLTDLEQRWSEYLKVLDRGILDLEREVELLKLYADFVDDRVFHDDDVALLTEVVKPREPDSLGQASQSDDPYIATSPEHLNPPLRDDSHIGPDDGGLPVMSGPDFWLTAAGGSDLEDLTLQITRLKQKRETLKAKVVILNEKLEEIKTKAEDLGHEASP